MITSVQWQDTEKESLTVVDDGITMCVPLAEGNREYKMVQDWIAQGNTIADPDPDPILLMASFNEFVNLFTPTEQAAIINSIDTQLKLFLLMAAGAGNLLLTNPEVIQGVNYLASLNIITPDRIPQILSKTAP